MSSLTPGCLAAIEQALNANFFRQVDVDQAGQRGVELEHQALEDISLHVGARETVEEKTVGLGVIGDRLFDDLHDDFVGDEAAGRNDVPQASRPSAVPLAISFRSRSPVEM